MWLNGSLAALLQNYGATHFIIGRDMAGSKSSLTGKDFYGALLLCHSPLKVLASAMLQHGQQTSGGLPAILHSMCARSCCGYGFWY